ncbi:hypothetical protein L3Q82_018105 [Scortum barcoo]|uniref:Uncharacterized protein n=1 Tax=Scortum barcoo TaxID=214431 RepID=A0ACB8VI96_9TELE|nr:hypothetical protein L3Q82_018105 [Scortum barcoo]
MSAQAALRTFSADAPLYKDKLDADRDRSAPRSKFFITSKISADCLHVVFQDSARERHQRSVSAPRWLEDRRSEWTALIAPGRRRTTAPRPARAPAPVRTAAGGSCPGAAAGPGARQGAAGGGERRARRQGAAGGGERGAGEEPGADPEDRLSGATKDFAVRAAGHQAVQTRRADTHPAPKPKDLTTTGPPPTSPI